MNRLISKICKQFIDDYNNIQITNKKDGGVLVTTPSELHDFVDQDALDIWLADRLADELENATKQARIETAERIAKILDGKGFIDYLDIEEIINENKE
jgi:hypothetical protein